MSFLRRVLLGLTIVAVLLVVSGYVFQRALGERLYARMVDRQAGRDIVADLPDGLHIALCGTGSPMPDPTRAGPCTAVIAGGRVLVFDVGEGSARNLARMGVNAGRIEAIFLTHFHSDHIDGLGALLLQRWIGGSHLSQTPIYGPEGVMDVVSGFDQAYRLDSSYRTAHHGRRIAPPTGAGGVAMTFHPEASKDPSGVVVYEEGGVVVRAFVVNHAPVRPAVGYRIDYAGRSVVISGDTVRSDRLAAAARGADLLVHEALQPRLLAHLTDKLASGSNPNLTQITRDIVEYHTTPEQAAATARAAGVKALVLNHIVPPQPLDFGYRAFLGDAAARFSGPITVGEDGMLFSLPRGSNAIKKRTLF